MRTRHQQNDAGKDVDELVAVGLDSHRIAEALIAGRHVAA
jgi:hypothetical protein